MFRTYFVVSPTKTIMDRDKVVKPELILNEANIAGMKKDTLVKEAKLQGLMANDVITTETTVEDLRKVITAECLKKNDPTKKVLSRLKVELKTLKADKEMSAVCSALTVAINALDNVVAVRALKIDAA